MPLTKREQELRPIARERIARGQLLIEVAPAANTSGTE
jgi:hypothetical protein